LFASYRATMSAAAATLNHERVAEVGRGARPHGSGAARAGERSPLVTLQRHQLQPQPTGAVRGSSVRTAATLLLLAALIAAAIVGAPFHAREAALGSAAVAGIFAPEVTKADAQRLVVAADDASSLSVLFGVISHRGGGAALDAMDTAWLSRLSHLGVDHAPCAAFTTVEYRVFVGRAGHSHSFPFQVNRLRGLSLRGPRSRWVAHPEHTVWLSGVT
jgi:hypothetical protein